MVLEAVTQKRTFMFCHIMLQLEVHLIVRTSFLFSVYYSNIQPKTLLLLLLLFSPMPPHVLMNFRDFPPGCGNSVADDF